MYNPKITDVTADDLIQKHGANAPRIVDVMVENAIRKKRYDEALELDRVLRVVKMRLKY
jgi:hypothetical protein